MICVIDEQDPVAHNNPHHHDDTLEGCYGKRRIGQKKHPEHTNDAQGNSEHDDERIKQGLKLRCHDYIDQQDGQRECQKKIPERFFLLLHVTTKPYLEPLRHVESGEFCPNIPRNAPQITAADIRCHIDDPLLLFPVNLNRGGSFYDRRDVSQQHLLTACCGENDIAEIIDMRSIIFTQSYENVVLIPCRWICVQRGDGSINACVDSTGNLRSTDP